nr:immunoglobulin light chain junction region [Macaca mulatta]MOX69257.1 immunoglobulin light chain junction region [Macaca mulatta]MOX69271.1 immunoglobulin light chain junction region [Macaca mulatta]MOX69335.1 immunoglobulin light chain junction region [Macaca mulatta]MOX69561.1 immunoglobulin light chain junction region [Macaca mulatta]
DYYCQSHDTSLNTHVLF